MGRCGAECSGLHRAWSILNTRWLLSQRLQYSVVGAGDVQAVEVGGGGERRPFFEFVGVLFVDGAQQGHGVVAERQAQGRFREVDEFQEHLRSLARIAGLMAVTGFSISRILRTM